MVIWYRRTGYLAPQRDEWPARGGHFESLLASLICCDGTPGNSPYSVYGAGMEMDTSMSVDLIIPRAQIASGFVFPSYDGVEA